MNRRSILKNAGAGLAATAGVSGAANADRTDLDHVPRIEPDAVRAALAADSTVLDELAADGVVDSASVDELEFDASADDDVVVVQRTDDGEAARRLSYTASVDGTEVVVGVDADGEAFAIDDRGNERITYGPAEMSGCYCSTACCCIPVCACCCQWTCTVR